MFILWYTRIGDVMQYLDGKNLQKKILKQIKEEVNLLKIKPILAVISIGDNSVNEAFFQQIKKMCVYVGYELEYYHYEDISLGTLLNLIKKLNESKKITSILILRPLLEHLPVLEVNNMILSSKDIDGVTNINQMKFQNREGGFISGTALGIIHLLEDYGIDMQQKNVVIINRSKEIGQTLFHYFLNKDCTVTVCHSKNKNLNEYIKQADIVVTAVGKANLFSLSVFKENSVVIDVGLECLDGKILGDIDVSNEEDCKISYLVKAIGGVGPMTIAALAENILKSYYLKVEDKENII